MSMDASLPDDLEAAQRELQAARDGLQAALRRLAHLESVLAETATTCEQQRVEIDKLKEEIELFKRHVFGRRSERFVEGAGQGHLFDLSGDEVSGESPSAPSEAAEEEITYRRRRRGHGWGPLPESLPHEEILIDVPEEERTCGCCGEPMQRIGEDRT
jgi:hypothetical protein